MKKVLKYIISLAVAAALLYFSFRGVYWEDFVNGLKNCRWEYILLGMAASIAAFAFRAFRWRDIMRPLDSDIDRLTTFNAVNIGNISNFVFPRIGEFVRCGVITRRSGATYDKVLGTVVLERAWDMLVMLLLFFGLVGLGWDKFGAFFIDRIWHPMAGSINFSLWWIVAAIVVVLSVLIWVIYKYRYKKRIAAKIYSICRGLVDGFSSCFRMEHKWKFFAYTVCIWSIYWLMAVSVLKAMPELDGLNGIDALFLMLAGSLGWLVPVPGGFGAFHFIVSLALSTIYGLPTEMGVVYATLSHEAQAVTMVLCGGASYISEAIRK